MSQPLFNPEDICGMPFNVNPRSIEQYLQDLAHGEDSYDDNFRNLEFHLHDALFRSLCRELTNQSTPRNLLPVRTPLACDPKWVSQALAAGRLVYNFAPTADLQRKLDHVADWIYAAEQQQAPWLAHCDERGRPYKLLKIGSVDQAVREADKAMNRGISQSAITLGAEDFRTVKQFADGARVDHLLTKKALDAESTAMRHCIGQGAYDHKLAAGTHSYFSLRSASGNPCVTMEVRHADNMLIQCQGRGNQPAAEKYRSYLLDFVRDRGFDLENPSDTGLIKNRGRYYDIHNLPENYSHDGDLDLAGSVLTKLPDGLHVTGRLNIAHSPISALPARLRVEGNLYANHTNISTIPADMRIDGSIDLTATEIRSVPPGWQPNGSLKLSTTPLTRLPEYFTIPGNLDLIDTPIAELPRGLKVEGLDLSHTVNLRCVPPDIKVAGDLVLTRSGITALPDNLVIGKSLYLPNTLLEELPRGLIVGGSLDIDDTKIRELPPDIKIGIHLCVAGTPIRTLPAGLNVPGNLSADRSLIETLPRGLLVGKSLSLLETPIRTLPPDVKIGVSLNLYGCKLDSLPEGLTIPDSINLNDASVAELPRRMEIGRDVHINSGTRLPHLPDYFCGRVQRPVQYAAPAPAPLYRDTAEPRKPANSTYDREADME